MSDRLMIYQLCSGTRPSPGLLFSAPSALFRCDTFREAVSLLLEVTVYSFALKPLSLQFQGWVVFCQGFEMAGLASAMKPLGQYGCSSFRFCILCPSPLIPTERLVISSSIYSPSTAQPRGPWPVTVRVIPPVGGNLPFLFP